MRMLNAQFGKKVILLIDEYDVPLSKASDTGYYDEMIDVLRSLLGNALKTNDYLKFAVITGCLKISRESIFTGVNNLVTNTITDKRYDEYFGFTEQDVGKLLEDAGLKNHAEELREWYDGYRFGSTDVYCPWDVLNHVAVLQDDPDAEPQTYWVNTSSNSILKRFFRKATKGTRQEIETLMGGGTITKKVSEQLTYHELEKSLDNLWSVLYTTGYLTVREKQTGGRLVCQIECGRWRWI